MKVVEGARWFFLLGDLHCWIVPSFSLKADPVLTPKSWTVKHEAYRSDSDIQLESDLLISG